MVAGRATSSRETPLRLDLAHGVDDALLRPHPAPSPLRGMPLGCRLLDLRAQGQGLAIPVSTPIEFSREVPDEKSLVGRVSVISRRVDRGSCFWVVDRGGVAPARVAG